MMLLLHLIVCVSFCFRWAFAAESLMTVFVQYVMDCNHDHPVTTQELELLRNHKFSDSKNTKCLEACVFKKIKWMNNKGMFDDEVAYNTSQKEFTDPKKLEQLKTLYTECKKVNDITFEGPDSNCERASALAKCLSDHSIKGNAVDKELQLWFMKNGVECSKEYPVTMEEFEDLKKHKIPDTKNAKCLLACVFKKINWMDDKGMFDDEAAYSLSKKKYTDPAKLVNARKLYDICKKVNDEKAEDGAAGCDRAKILAKCLIQNSAKLGFLNAD